MSDYQNRSSVAQAARVNGAGDIITSDTLLRWAVQGKIFEAGFGAADSAIAMVAAVADTTPSYSLQSPASTSLLVIPILAKVAIIVDGNAITKIICAFTKPAGLCATAMTLSGTALTSKHCLYRSSPAPTAQQSTVVSGVTASALVAADYVAYHYGQAIDAVLTTGKVALGEGPSNVHALRFLEDGFPHILTSGAAMLLYVTNGTTDGTSKTYFQWAEVTKDDLY